ncbi:MAG: acetolactate synthase large subunit, partial [Archangium sp.]
RVATDERPGPVHLELPEDIAAQSCDGVPLISPHPIDLSRGSEVALDRAAEILKNAKRPLVMFGAAASRPRSTEVLAKFIQRTRIPFFTTQMGKGTVSGGSDFYMGTAALSERDYVHEAIERADVIVTVGHDTAEKPPFLMGVDGPQVIHVGYLPAHIEQVYFPETEIIGDIGPSLTALADRVEGKLPNAEALRSLQKGILSRLSARNTEDRFTPQRIVHDVRAVMPEDGVLALDNGMYKIWFARNYRTRMANTLLLDNALATMGAGLPSAMAVSMLYPKRRVMAVCGDGGFMMNSQELETAVRLKLNVVVLVLEDHAYGMIRWKQAVDQFPDFGMTFNNPDFVKYAEAYGAKGSRVTDIKDFIPTLERAFTEGGVHLVVVPIDYSENGRVLVQELKQRLPVTEEK